MTFEDLTNEFSNIEETKRLLESKQTQDIMKGFTPMQLTVLMLNMEIKAYHSVEQYKQKVKDAWNKYQTREDYWEKEFLEELRLDK